MSSAGGILTSFDALPKSISPFRSPKCWTKVSILSQLVLVPVGRYFSISYRFGLLVVLAHYGSATKIPMRPGTSRAHRVPELAVPAPNADVWSAGARQDGHREELSGSITRV